MHERRKSRNSIPDTGHSHRRLGPEDVIATVQDPWTRWGDIPGGGLLASQLIMEPEDSELADLFGLVCTDQIRNAALSCDSFYPNYPPAGQLLPVHPGRIPITALPTGDVLSLGIEDVLKNVLIVRPTGGGKTNAIKAIIAAILEFQR